VDLCQLADRQRLRDGAEAVKNTLDKLVVGSVLLLVIASLVGTVARAQNPSATFTATIVPAPVGSNCQLGNHGPVRNWAHVANGTLIADDGCPLNNAAASANSPNGPGWINSEPWGVPFSLSFYQDLVSTGHFNGVTVYGPIDYTDECEQGAPDPFYDTNGSSAAAHAETYFDAAVSYAQQTGMYVMLTPYICGPPDTPTATTLLQNWWTVIAPRYANDTNVIYQIDNEPDYWSYGGGGLGPFEDAGYNTIRQYAPNTPIIAWTYYTIGNLTNNFVSLMQSAPNISYANAVVGFHGYAPSSNSAIASFIAMAQSNGYPVAETEGWPDGGTPPDAAYLQVVAPGGSNPIYWVDSTGWPDPPCSSYTPGNNPCQSPPSWITWPRDSAAGAATLVAEASAATGTLWELIDNQSGHIIASGPDASLAACEKWRHGNPRAHCVYTKQ
jgi:Cellulase (glycosyl hydrolase family 5)